MLSAIQTLFIAGLAARSNAFLVVTPPLLSTTVRSAEPAAAGSSADLFKSEGWKPIEQDLDQLPVFTCANKEGKPLPYTIDTNDKKSFTVPFFYCDVDDAREELRKAQENTGLEGLDLIPYPLGKAFQMWASDEAVIVPNKQAILQAGAPPETNPVGQHVPLFCCMEVMRAGEDGESTSLPLFMSHEDARLALEEAVENDGGSADDFEIVSLSLNRAVELLATVPETPAFQFVAPEKSFAFIQKYMADSG